MKEEILPSSALDHHALSGQGSGSGKAGFLANLARRVVLARLAGMNTGRLVIKENEKAWRFGVSGPESRVEVLDPNFWGQVAFGGSVGAGEAYMDGMWRCDDLVGLMGLLLRNRAVLDGMEGGLARLSAPLRVLLHRLNRNTRAGSRRNIAAHYDLGNDFYRLWLDETMMYSCAVFEHPDMSLAQASTANWSASAASWTWGRTTMCWRSAPAGAALPSMPQVATVAASPPPPFPVSNTTWREGGSRRRGWKAG